MAERRDGKRHKDACDQGDNSHIHIYDNVPMPRVVPVIALRLAATVMLLRPNASFGVQVYLLRRNARSAFAPDAFVFPGGTLDDCDLEPEAIAQTLGVDTRVNTELSRAAIRELFEEAGILLACDKVGARAVASETDRARVNSGELTFNHLLMQRGWRADARGLVLFSHWITPPSEPRRYDTYFFIASAPRGQTAFADALETHDGIWITPQEALMRARDGSLHIVYPTIKHLERLIEFARVEDAIAFARGKPILTIMPDDTPQNGFTMPTELENAW